MAGLDINEDGLDETVRLINEALSERATGGSGESGGLGGRAVAYRCDVTSEESVNSAVAAVAADLGAPSVLCNIAGIGGFFHTVDMPVERWQEIIGVNLTGPFLMCRATVPHLIEQGGAIVNIASNTGLTGQAYTAAYCSSKAGVLMLSKALAAEYASKGVRVNTVAPGPTDTPIIASFDLPEGADGRQLYKMMTPMGVRNTGRDGGVHRLSGFRRLTVHHRRGAVRRRRPQRLNPSLSAGRDKDLPSSRVLRRRPPPNPGSSAGRLLQPAFRVPAGQPRELSALRHRMPGQSAGATPSEAKFWADRTRRASPPESVERVREGSW